MPESNKLQNFYNKDVPTKSGDIGPSKSIDREFAESSVPCKH